MGNLRLFMNIFFSTCAFLPFSWSALCKLLAQVLCPSCFYPLISPSLMHYITSGLVFYMGMGFRALPKGPIVGTQQYQGSNCRTSDQLPRASITYCKPPLLHLYTSISNGYSLEDTNICWIIISFLINNSC